MSATLSILTAAAALIVALWACGRAGRMSWRTNHADRAAIVAIAVGAAGCGGYLLAGVYLPPLMLLMLFGGLAWWFGAPCWREWRRRRMPATLPGNW